MSRSGAARQRQQTIAWTVDVTILAGVLTTLLGLVSAFPIEIAIGLLIVVVGAACAVVLPRTGLSTRIPFGQIYRGAGVEPPASAPRHPDPGPQLREDPRQQP